MPTIVPEEDTRGAEQDMQVNAFVNAFAPRFIVPLRSVFSVQKKGKMVASIKRSRRVSHICISANTLATMLVSGDTGRARSASRSKAEADDQGHTNGRSANMHT